MRAVVCWAVTAGLLSLHGVGATAVIPDWTQAGWQWTEEHQAVLSGVHFFQRELSAPVAPAEVARTLSVRMPQLKRLMVLDGQILLSGMDASHHWFARIERTAAGATAMVSAMTVQQMVERRGEFDAVLYALADMRLQFRHAAIQNGERVTQALYISGLSVPVLSDQLASALSTGGWSLRETELNPGRGLWGRANEQLNISVQKHASGSVLWLQHQEIGAP